MMRKGSYQCSVHCHCGRPSIQVDCYGTFEYCEGTCSRCGTRHIGKQIPLSNGNHRYETEEIPTVTSGVMKTKEFLKDFCDAWNK